ncbi:hypothetical protein LTS12_025213 [Elasticomyces elasticus]|nr:hypothetical protein LTS12_025213 [Elasticomyces elasticus]
MASIIQADALSDHQGTDCIATLPYTRQGPDTRHRDRYHHEHIAYHVDSKIPGNGLPPFLRLIRLVPNLQASYQLQLFSTTALPPYTALSYTWGKPEKTCEISINEKRFMITGNLDRLLRRVVLTALGQEWLWVDQVCIAQDDIEDRNQQVRAMGKIFSSAFRTVVWLGDNTRLPWHFSGNIRFAFCVRKAVTSGAKSLLDADVELLLSEDVQLLVQWPQTQLVRLDWWAFLRFLQHIRNHTRERMNSRKPGTSDADGMLVIPSSMWRILRSRAAIICEEACERSSKATTQTFWHVIQAHSYTLCADVRDRLFALVDLVHMYGPRGKLRIDYAFTPERLLLEALLCLTDGRSAVPAFRCAETLREMLCLGDQVVTVSCHLVVDLRTQDERVDVANKQAGLHRLKQAPWPQTHFTGDYSTCPSTLDWATTSELSACAFKEGMVALCDLETCRHSIGAFAALGTSIPYLREAGVIVDKVDIVAQVSAADVELEWDRWKTLYPHKSSPFSESHVYRPQTKCSHRHAFGLRYGVPGLGLPLADLVEATIEYRQPTESAVVAREGHNDDPQATFFASQHNIGAVCSGAQVGDVICGCSSAGVHLVLRPMLGGDRVFEIIGHATRIKSGAVSSGIDFVRLFIGKVKGVFVKRLPANFQQ